MGQSSSSERRTRAHHYPPPPRPPQPPPPPPPPPSYPYLPNPNYNSTPHPYATGSYRQQLASGYNNLMRFVDTLIVGTRSNYNSPSPSPYNTNIYYNYAPAPNQGLPGPFGVNSPSPSSSSSMAPAQAQPPQYVESQKAKTVKNDVNVHKDTICLEVDELHPDHYLVSFVFDAMLDGSVTIYYFAQEGSNCSFSPVYPDMYTPTRFPFQKGPGQKFRQPSGSGIDLGFFELDDLSKPMNGDVFPLVIYAEAQPQTMPSNEQLGTCSQINQAVINKASDGSFQVKVIKQILWANGERYELQEIFGLANSAEPEAASNGANSDDDEGKECVICLSEPRNTAVLPCRHMCMCSECAKALRLQSNKCPICRQSVEKLMEINVN